MFKDTVYKKWMSFSLNYTWNRGLWGLQPYPLILTATSSLTILE